jgi:hypothetical protein
MNTETEFGPKKIARDFGKNLRNFLEVVWNIWSETRL